MDHTNQSSENNSDVKTVTVTGEAAEYLEPKKTRKNRKASLNVKSESEMLGGSNNSNNTNNTNNNKPPEIQTNNFNETNNSINNSFPSIPVAQGTFDASSKSIIPKSQTQPVILTRKNKVQNTVLKEKPVLKVPIKSENKPEHKVENKVEKKPVMKVEPKSEPKIENKSESKSEIKAESKQENKPETKQENKEHNTRKHKFGGRRISISIAEADPKTRKARKNIKKKVASMSVDEIRDKLAKDGLINKDNKKIPEIMLRNMMKDSLLLASGK